MFGRRQDSNGVYVGVIPRFIKTLINDERPTINGDGKQSPDFTYIEKVIEAKPHQSVRIKYLAPLWT